MSTDIERHDFVPGPRADRCAECYQPAGHSIHGGRRPAKCRMTGPHNGHAGCAGIDFPEPEISDTRFHSSDDMDGLAEFAGVTEPTAVAIRPDGSVDVYGYIAVVDQRAGRLAAPAPLVSDVVDIWQYRE